MTFAMKRFACAVALAPALSAGLAAERVVKVGLFEAPPLVMTSGGKAQGLFIDLIDEFARRGGWKVEYVYKPWPAQLEALRKGEIDLLPALSYTPQREASYDFSKTPVFIDSGVVYAGQSHAIKTLADLEGKRVAALQGSIFTKAFEEQIARFNIHLRIVYTSDNEQVFDAIEKGNADAGVTIYSLGTYLSKKRQASLTPIAFSPLALEFATPKGMNGDLLVQIDANLRELKEDSSSVYYHSYAKWLNPENGEQIALALGWTVGILAAVGAMLILWSYSLRRQVRTQTSHIRGEKDKLAVILEGIGDAVVALDSDHRIEMINKPAQDILGTTAPACLGRELAEFAAFRDFPRSPATDGQTIHTRDGRECYVEGSASPLGPLGDQSGGTVLVFRDLTERKKTEAALQRSDKLNALAILAGGIAHDFNNLLGGIFGYLQLATEATPPEAESARYLEKAMSVYERAKGLARQLLTFSSGGLPVKVPGDIGELVRSSVGFAAAGSNVKIDLSLPPALPFCEIDAGQIGQVVDNLIINARQAMPAGGTVHIAASVVDGADQSVSGLAAGPHVKISVRDEGQGIPAEVEKNLFIPFFTTKMSGHGLGLATCLSIVRHHGGAMEVDAGLGSGATFTLYLPTIAASPRRREAEGQPDHARSGRVVVMDDEEFMRDILSMQLASLGYSVEIAKSGSEVLAILPEGCAGLPEFVLLDLTVPGGLGGIDTCRELRRRFPDLAIFACSGYAQDPAMANPAAYGFSGAIGKPFTKAALAQLVREGRPARGTV